MVSFKSLSLLALAGSAIAAPALHGNNHAHKRALVIETFVETKYVTVTAGQPIPTPEAEAAEPTPVVQHKKPQKNYGYPTQPKVTTTVVPQPPKETAVYQPQPPPQPSSAPVEPSQPPPSNPPPSSNTGYMATVDEWRSKMGLAPLTKSSKLEGNARKTAADGNGQMKHQLLDGTFGQVLAPGQPNQFEHVFVGGWLCERPNLKGLEGVCQSAKQGWANDGQTGHADILTDPKYKTIGCACEGGIWSCDLGW